MNRLRTFLGAAFISAAALTTFAQGTAYGGSLSNLNAPQLTSGAVLDARLSSNVSLLGQTMRG